MEKVTTMADLNISKNPQEEGGKKSILAHANAWLMNHKISPQSSLKDTNS